MICKI